MVEQGGVEVNGEKVTDIAMGYTAQDLIGSGLMVKKGKKTYHKVNM